MDNNHPGGLSPALLQHMHAVLSKQAGLYWEHAQTPLDGAADLAKFITSLESILQLVTGLLPQNKVMQRNIHSTAQSLGIPATLSLSWMALESP